MISSFIFIATMIITGIPTAVLFIPWCWLTGNVLPLYKGTRFMLFSSCRLAGVRFRTVGLENIHKERACIFMSNHVSNIDPPVTIPLIPRRSSVMIKKELFRVPILGKAMRMGSMVPVDRGNRDAGIDSVRAATQVVQQGLNMIIYVEGKRSFDGRLLPFKKGPFFLAMAAGAPVIPVSIYGSEKILGKGSLRMHPGTAEVVFHPPIDPAGFATREELMQAVRAAIASGLPEWMRT